MNFRKNWKDTMVLNHWLDKDIKDDWADESGGDWNNVAIRIGETDSGQGSQKSVLTSSSIKFSMAIKQPRRSTELTTCMP